MTPAAVDLAALLLAAAFAWAALAKAFRPRAWWDALDGYGLRGAPAAATAVLVPAVEATAAALLLFGALRAGAALAVALLAGFSLAILRARSVIGDVVPCGCFGRSHARDYRLLLVRNALLGACAAVALTAASDDSIFDGWRAPRAGEALPAFLVGAGLAVAAWTAWRVSSGLRGGRGT